MSLIVAIAEGGEVVMGGDSAASVNNVVHITTDGKVIRKEVAVGDGPSFEREGVLMGYCGLHRLGDILRHCFEPPRLPAEGWLLDSYLRKDFTKSLRESFREAGYLDTVNGHEMFEGRLLIGVRGRLFNMDAYFAAVQAIYAAAMPGRQEYPPGGRAESKPTERPYNKSRERARRLAQRAK